MEKRYWVTDTETTGISHSEGHRLIEVGAIELIGRKLTGRYVHFYLNPGREIDAAATKVHGITLKMLKDKPMFKDVASDVMEIFKGTTIIAHNASFDMGFLNNELELAGYEGGLNGHCEVLDTLKMARDLYPQQRNSLDALCKRLNVDNSSRDLHGALIDCEILIDVYLAMTGGQKSLIEPANPVQDKPKNSSQANSSPTSPQNDGPKLVKKAPLHISEKLKVIKPSKDESDLHQAVCEKLALPVF